MRRNGRPKLLTPAGDQILHEEAQRRADRLEQRARFSNKQLADKTGLAQKYVANLVARYRREIEARINVNVSRGTDGVLSTQSRANVSEIDETQRSEVP